MEQTLFLLLCLVVGALGSPTGQDHGPSAKFDEMDGRIVGGSGASQGAFPYQVSLRSLNGRHFCGGSIISNRWILTAGHCMQNVPNNGVMVVVGTNTLNTGGTSYYSDMVIVHQYFNSNSLANDIALIRVNRYITFNNLVRAIPLPSYNIAEANYPAVVSGWGVQSVNGDSAYYLQYLNTRLMDHNTCKRQDRRISDSNICSFTQSGQGNCYGDSGGPLAADGCLVGIVSWGQPCATGSPDIYTRVYSYLNWIRNYVN